MKNDILATAIKAAKSAGIVLKKRFRADVLVEDKADGSFVSVVDREAERAALSVIQENFLEHSIFSEEAGFFYRNSEYMWYVDPLDGTTNFLHHVPFFCVSVACTLREEVIAGVIYDAIHDELFYASKGEGAFLNGGSTRFTTGKKISVSNPKMEKAVISATRPSDRMGKELGFKIASAVEQHVHGVKFMGSAALDLAYTAYGRFDGFIGFGIKPHDVAAGILICEEAGAITLDFSGKPGKFKDANMIVANREVAKQLVKYIKKAYKNNNKN
ncbi:MAG: hypothetical protein A3G49_06620 [Candidatus Sungbacteria bacterium RIFCSPLOWO2_12_FULL_41_11]|uniref:Inositol-1-monophosphatase n=1 Tax=Candidatus Sungbacteria bacterium RIFCSPLOWO2_12_FULL_41_11 TaxID=1802286 RepID=A0A1G2LUK4_9BACT|nr:MAG: Inositol-phosphate phosphatase [Parcubacteria group bacterium GW2011_GWA2_42_14]OHA14491.1 MAG: hypothetical protein A3G49_06620 [Candidatus Sungbacteria bacterium RIFCSPLOWO2_12_FULL_41_11]